MFRFDFFPVLGAVPKSYAVQGRVLTVTIQGQAPLVYDLTPMVEGGILLAADIPGAEAWLHSTEITLWEGVLHLCVEDALPAREDDIPRHIRHPDSIDVTTNGPVPLPSDGLKGPA